MSDKKPAEPPSTQPATGSPLRSSESPIARTVLVWLTAALLVGGGVFLALARWQAGDWNPWNEKEPLDHYEIARTSVAMTGLLGAAVAAGLATRRQRSQERSVEIANATQLLGAQTYALELQRADQDVIRQLRERYTAAAAQLGSESPAVRLAGVYAIAALADDWLARKQGSADAQACVDVLCAYLRTPRGESSTPQAIASEREVRQTIVRVITSHLVPDARTPWSECDFDMSGAVFDGDYSFATAVFRGRVTFAGASFRGVQTTFDRAKFTNSSPGALNFGSSIIETNLSLNSCEFSRGVNLDHAYLAAGGTLAFKNADFHGVVVSASSLDCQGTLTFQGAHLHDGSRLNVSGSIDAGLVSLAETILHGVWIGIGPLALRAGSFSFQGARVANETRIEFTEFDMQGGSLTLDEAVFDSGGALSIDRSNVDAPRLSYSGTNFGSVAPTLSGSTVTPRLAHPWVED